MSAINMEDGKGALYFVRPQATKKTRQEMREDCQYGVIDMPKSFGKASILERICAAVSGPFRAVP